MFFKPTVGLTLLLLVPALVFGRLGLWQLERKEEKQMLFESFENAPAMSIEQAISQAERFALVNAFGHYDAKRHILLDNKILNGRAGVHVLTPFHLTDGTVLLVNRGWLPMPADRLSLPAVPTDSSPQTITGRLNGLPTEGVRVGAADVLTTDDWPQLVTYLDQKPIESALDEILSGWIIQLDAGDPSGFDGRQWTPAVMEPAVHGAYAFQWFSLLIATIVFWVVLGVRQGRLKAKGT